MDLRSRLHDLWCPVHARGGLHPAQGGAHPHRRVLRALVGEDTGHDRCGRLPALLLPRHGVLPVRRSRRGVVSLGDRRAYGPPDRERAVADVTPQGRDPADRFPPAAPGRLRADPMRAGDPGARPVSQELLGFVLFGVFFVAIFAGFPIAFTLMFLSLALGYFAFGDMVFYLAVFHTIGLIKEQVLVAVPLFIFM